jgi:APA family basic amino acid/polyamine antiporter
MAHRHVGSYRTITVIAAVSYGELSAMFPKAGGQYIYIIWKTRWFLYGWSFFAVIQTGTIAAVGVAFAKFTAYLFQLLVIKNILYEIGDLI